MKILYFICALLSFTMSVGQDSKVLNKGKVVPKNYNVSIPYKDIRGLVIVQVVIKGKSYDFIVDTGAMTAVSQQLAGELGLKSSAGLDVDDSSNLRKAMKLVTLPPVQVAGISFTNTPAVVAENNPFFQCLGIHGFIGSNMLRNSIVKFSYKDKTVSLTDKLANFTTDKKNSALLLEDKLQSNPYLRIILKNNEVEGGESLLFDTGMIGLYDLSKSVYDSLRKFDLFVVKNQAKGAFSLGINGIENQTEHYRLLLPELNFAGISLRNVNTTTTSDNVSRIGSQMLTYGDIIIDYPEKQLFFNPYVNQIIDVTEKSWPVQPVIKDGKFVVGIVWDPALNDKINEGDEILKFGEIDFSNIHPCETLRSNIRPQTDFAVMILKDKVSGSIKNVEISKQ